MKNPWTISLDVLVEWIATLPAEGSAEHAAWFRTALEQGEALDVYRVQRVRGVGYDRDVDGAPGAFLRDHPDVDAGQLLAHDHIAMTRVAFHGPAGDVVEDELSDLGTALAMHRRRVRHQPPLELMVFDWSRPPDPPVEMRVSARIYSDIWLPWTDAFEDLDSPAPEFGDNRALASRHTPRLNAYLAALREVTVSLGGRWELDRSDLGPEVAFQVAEDGVRLDTVPPPVR